MMVPRPKQSPKRFNNKNSYKNTFSNKTQNVNENKRFVKKNSDDEYENIVKCSHCKRPGHSYKQCWELNPQLKPAKFRNNNKPSLNKNSKN